MPAPTIDGSVINKGSGASTAQATLTTTKTNDIILFTLHTETNGGAPLSVTGVSGGGLTWAKRKQFNNGDSSIEIWWALAATPLAAVTIIATLSGTYDDCVIVACGVNGCITAAPWDVNAAVPATSTANPQTATISTTNANDLILALMGCRATGAYSNVPTGFTFVNGGDNGGGLNFSELGLGVLAVTAAQSGTVVTWGSPTGSVGPVMIVDALAGAASSLKGGGGGFSMHHPYGVPGQGKGPPSKPPPVPPPPPPPPPPPVIDPPPPMQPTNPVCPPAKPCPPGFWPT